MNPLFRIDFSISDSLKIVRKSVLIYETIIPLRSEQDTLPAELFQFNDSYVWKLQALL